MKMELHMHFTPTFFNKCRLICVKKRVEKKEIRKIKFRFVFFLLENRKTSPKKIGEKFLLLLVKSKEIKFKIQMFR